MQRGTAKNTSQPIAAGKCRRKQTTYRQHRHQSNVGNAPVVNRPGHRRQTTMFTISHHPEYSLSLPHDKCTVHRIPPTTYRTTNNTDQTV